jgi:hypothetical protein
MTRLLPPPLVGTVPAALAPHAIRPDGILPGPWLALPSSPICGWAAQETHSHLTTLGDLAADRHLMGAGAHSRVPDQRHAPRSARERAHIASRRQRGRAMSLTCLPRGAAFASGVPQCASLFLIFNE